MLTKEHAMKAAFAVETTIERPPDVVWTGLTNWGEAHRWMNGVDELRAEGETAVGTRIVFVARGKERSSEIASCTAGRSITLRSVQGGVTADYVYEVMPLDDGRSRVKLVAGCQTQGFAWALMAPLLRFAIRMTDRGQLAALKDVLERG
jgi:carbon monoxide dehydrogenase subunit G